MRLYQNNVRIIKKQIPAVYKQLIKTVKVLIEKLNYSGLVVQKEFVKIYKKYSPMVAKWLTESKKDILMMIKKGVLQCEKTLSAHEKKLRARLQA